MSMFYEGDDTSVRPQDVEKRRKEGSPMQDNNNAREVGGTLVEYTMEEKLRDLLEEAIHLMQEYSDNHEGYDPFGIPCGNCDAAVPMRHSFGCRAASVLSLVSKRRPEALSVAAAPVSAPIQAQTGAPGPEMKRFDPFISGHISEDPEGDYILHSDHLSALKELQDKLNKAQVLVDALNNYWMPTAKNEERLKLLAESQTIELQDRIKTLEADNENLLWNLGGCDAIAAGWSKPFDYSKELARPALDTVSRLADRLSTLRASFPERAKEVATKIVQGAYALHGRPVIAPELVVMEQEIEGVAAIIEAAFNKEK